MLERSWEYGRWTRGGGSRLTSEPRLGQLRVVAEPPDKRGIVPVRRALLHGGRESSVTGGGIQPPRSIWRRENQRRAAARTRRESDL